MSKENPIITIDGPAGAGKSTISRKLAALLGYTYIDTGAMYRAIALSCLENGIDWLDEEKIAAHLDSIQLSFELIDGVNHIFLNGEDVESKIRTPKISKGASIVSAYPVVRDYLLVHQRRLGNRGKTILEGRDTGTVVFPEADFKFFLDASAEERAARRFRQLGDKADKDQATLQKEIEQRDKADRERTIAPLRCPPDALSIDSSHLDVDQVVELIIRQIQS